MILDILNESMGSEASTVEPTANGYGIDGGMEQILMETAMDVHRLNKACYIGEYKSIGLIQESYEEYVSLNEGIMDGFFEKLQNIVKTMWKKVTELFSNAKLYFNKFADAQSFVSKYKEEIKGANMADFEYKGYTFNTSAIDIVGCYEAGAKIVEKHYAGLSKSKFESVSSKEGYDSLKTSVKELNDVDDLLDRVRGAMIGGSNLSTEDFKEKVMVSLRGGDEPKEIGVSPSAILKEVDTFKSLGNAIDAEKRKVDANHKKTLDIISNCKKEAENGAKATGSDEQYKRSGLLLLSSMLQAKATKTKDVLSIANSVTSMKLQVLKEQKVQAKDIAYKLVAHSRKTNKALKEGFEVTESGNFLDSILGSL